MTASPNARLPDAEIETSLEAFVTPSGECLWRRVAVWSGPCSPQRIIHASFVLPTHGDLDLPVSTTLTSAATRTSLVCWAAFPERPNHKLLCVLVNPSTLSIWDVYPDSSNTISSSSNAKKNDVYVSAEGHSVSLPFHCSSIYPLGASHGLLLQRQEDQEDLEARAFITGTPFHHHHHNYHQQQVGGGQKPMDEEEDEFFLKVPPRNTRMDDGSNTDQHQHDSNDPTATLSSQQSPHQHQHQSSATSVGGGNHNHNSMLQTPRTQYGGPSEVSSLFSLKHPLEDVLPVSYWSSPAANNNNNSNDHNHDGGGDQQQDALVTDVFEKILHTETLRWTDRAEGAMEKQFYEQPVCVTYHTVLKRHAIWVLKGAPAPAPTPPLWQRSRHWRSQNNRDWDDHIGMIDQDTEDLDLLGVTDAHHPANAGGPTREDALADALGVRKTPRRVTDSAVRGGGGHANNRNSIEPPASVNRSGFYNNNNNNRSAVKETSFLDTTSASVAVAETTQLLNLRPMSNLHPNVAVECLFEEASESEPASNVIFSSNAEGSGLLIIGLVNPVVVKTEGDNPNVLRLFSVEPTTLGVQPMSSSASNPPGKGTLSETLKHSFTVKLTSTIPCMAAQPVQSTQTPQCFLPHRKNRSGKEHHVVTDMLILKRTPNTQPCMSIQRSHIQIGNCAIWSEEHSNSQKFLMEIADIKNAVGGNIDFVKRTDNKNTETCIRGNLSLEMLSNALAEKVIVAIESRIFGGAPSPQSTVPHMEFALKLRADCCRLEQSLSSTNNFDPDSEWLAVSSLLDAIVDFELFGTAINASQKNTEASSKTGSGSAWASLLTLSFHSDFSLDNCDTLFLGTTQNDSFSIETSRDATPSKTQRQLSSIGSAAIACLTESGGSIVPALFDTVHLLFEDFKLSSDSSLVAQLRSVGSFLIKTCCKCMATDESSTMLAFLDHYKQDLGASWVHGIEEVYSNRKHSAISAEMVTSFFSPPCILACLDAMIRNAKTDSIYATSDASTINAACSSTRSLLRIYGTLFRLDKNVLEREYEVVTTLCEEGFRSADSVREELATGVAIPLLEAVSRCRGDPEHASNTGWTAAEFALVGRQDMSINNGSVPASTATKQASKSVPVRTSDPDNPRFEDKEKDGIVPLIVSSALLFPADNRVKEAGRLLRSSKPCFLSVPRAIEVNDHEYGLIKQSKLLLLCRRSLALPVGRGMLTIGSFQPVAAEPLPVPILCMSGRVPPANSNLALDMSECHGEFLVWPEFHNGVAAGLRLPLESEIGDSISKISRTWIVYNRPNPNNMAQPQNQTNGQPPVVAPNNQSHAHGGLLLALGLRGHLAALEMTDIYDYLTQGQVTLTCGVLLGMAANKRGTCDISVSKMLCLHLPSLIPNHFSSIDVNSSVQQAAALGAGLLFQGSSHRMMTEFLLNEIGRRPESDVTLDREAYTLSCGIALGMVNICKGENIIDGQHAGGGEGLADLRIEERLYRYIVGGTDEGEMHRTREANDRLNIPTAPSSGENERCSCVFEGNSVNIDVTAAGATLALGLIFLRSGNRNIASILQLPQTHFLLEYVRPDFLSLRVIAKALILWDDVKPTKQWIEAQLPQVVRDAYKQMQSKMRTATDFGDMLESEDGEGSGSSISYKEMPVFQGEGKPANSGTTQERQAQAQDYDAQAVRQIYVHVVAGACFGLGLRYAGTANKDAAAAIFERLVELQTLRDANDSVSVAMRPELQILESCIGSLAISLAMVNAGTGDMETLKLFKILRWRCDDEVKFGTHMSYAMAIGLLFLGGGTCTLGREPEDIAALVAAFFPRFPFTTIDNQYHLQALRHLYALAVKRRDLRFVDVDTGEIVPILVQIKYQNQSSDPINLTAPCLLPNTDDTALEGRIVSVQFYPLKFDFNNDVFGRTLFVKRRYDTSIHTQQSLFIQSGNSGGGFLADVTKALPGNPYIQAFAKYICARSAKGKSQYGVSTETFIVAVLQECLAGYSDTSLPVYLKLRTSIASIEANSTSASLLTWDFRLVRSFYEMSNREGAKDARAMLNIEKVAYLSEFVDTVVNLQQRYN